MAFQDAEKCLRQKKSNWILINKLLIKGACQDIPYDPVEDDDGLIQQPSTNKKFGFMTIVKIKKKACVCLKDLNQLNDYDNFV